MSVGTWEQMTCCSSQGHHVDLSYTHACGTCVFAFSSNEVQRLPAVLSEVNEKYIPHALRKDSSLAVEVDVCFSLSALIGSGSIPVVSADAKARR